MKDARDVMAGRMVWSGGALFALMIAVVAAVWIRTHAGDVSAAARASVSPLPFAGEERGEGATDSPLYFEPAPAAREDVARFFARGPDYLLWLSPAEAVMAVRAAGAGEVSAHLRIQWPGAETGKLEGAGALPGVSHYLTGRDSAAWRHDVPHYSAVRQRALYPGIDLVYYGAGGKFEYDLEVAPHADPGVIRMRFPEAESVHLDARGDLRVRAGGRDFVLRKPVAWQEMADGRHAVAAHFILAGGEAGFALGEYDRARPLVIDPVLTLGTPLGGGADEEGLALAAGADGSTYLAGRTASADFPTGNPLRGAAGGEEAFIVKRDAAGALVYATYLGGGGDDIAYDIAADAAGNAYIAGTTASADFPVQGALYGSLAGGRDAFVAKLNADGSALLFSTYLGGGGRDEGWSLALGLDGSVYVAGGTASSNFPVSAGSLQSTLGGEGDGFLSRLTASGSALLYSTYLGGVGADSVAAIATDGGGVYLTGSTASVNFPVTPAGFQRFLNGGMPDVFAAKFDTLNTLVYASYLGGTGYERGEAIAVDGAGRAYIAGGTGSPDFPVRSAYQIDFGQGTYDAFVARVSADGGTLEHATYLGGAGEDSASAIAIDGAGVVVAGETASPDFPLAHSLQHKLLGGSDAFITRFALLNAPPTFSTYLGGTGEDRAADLAVDGAGAYRIAGTSMSSGFPRVTAWQAAGGGDDAFVAVIDPAGADVDLRLTAMADPDPVLQFGTVALNATATNDGAVAVDSVLIEYTLPDAFQFQSATASQGTCAASGASVTCELGTLAPGASATTTVNARAREGKTHITRIALARAGRSDSDTSNNSVEVESLVTGGNGGGGGVFFPLLPLLIAVAVVRVMLRGSGDWRRIESG